MGGFCYFHCGVSSSIKKAGHYSSKTLAAKSQTISALLFQEAFYGLAVESVVAAATFDCVLNLWQ